MTYADFWDGACDMAKDYRKAHELKREEDNYFAWLQGAYVYHAIAALSPALNAFAKGRAQEYMKMPFGYERQEEKPVNRQKESDSKAKQWLEMWAINFNEKFDQQLGGGANG